MGIASILGEFNLDLKQILEKRTTLKQFIARNGENQNLYPMDVKHGYQPQQKNLY